MRPVDSDHEGTFAQLSFTQLLVRALDERWSGTIFIEPPFDLLHVIQIDRGLVSRVLVPDEHANLGALLVEAGVVMESELELALSSDELLGQALIGQGVIDDRTLKRALVLQVLRRLVRVFDFPTETEWTFTPEFEAFVDLPDGTRLDTLRVLWAGLSAHGELPDRMAATLEQLGSSTFQLRPEVTLSRFGFTGDAARVIGVITADRTTMSELLAREIAPPEVVRSILYLLTITRHLDVSPVGETADPTESLSTEPSTSSVADSAPSSSEGGDEGGEKPARRVARIQLRRVTFRGAAPDLPGTGESQSRPSSEGRTSEQGDVMAQAVKSSSVAHGIESRLARLDRESEFSLLGIEPATLEGKDERAVTELLWQAYEAAGRWHPDHCPKKRPELRAGMKKLYESISDAFVTLADPETRARCIAAVAKPSEDGPADGDTSGLRPVKPSDDQAAVDLSATVPSAGAPDEGASDHSEVPVSAVPTATMRSEAMTELGEADKASPEPELEAVTELEAPSTGDRRPPPEAGEPTRDRAAPTWSPSELHERALVALAEKRPSEALELCQQACDAEPDNPDYLASALWIRAKLPRPDLKVLTLDLDDLLRTHLDHLAGRYYRGMLRRRLGYDSAAKQDFERVLDLDPDHAGARAQWVELGKAAGRRG